MQVRFVSDQKDLNKNSIYLILLHFIILFLGPYPAMFRAYSWLSTQQSLLVVFEGPQGVPGSATSRASSFLLYCIDPQVPKSNLFSISLVILMKQVPVTRRQSQHWLHSQDHARLSEKCLFPLRTRGPAASPVSAASVPRWHPGKRGLCQRGRQQGGAPHLLPRKTAKCPILSHFLLVKTISFKGTDCGQRGNFTAHQPNWHLPWKAWRKHWHTERDCLQVYPTWA